MNHDTEKVIEERVGMSIEEIRNKPLDPRKDFYSTTNSSPMDFSIPIRILVDGQYVSTTKFRAVCPDITQSFEYSLNRLS